MNDSRISTRRRVVWLVGAGLAIAAVPGTAAAQGGRARLHDDELRVTGSNKADVIAVRLAAGQPGVVEVDFGDDGSADFSFDRSAITRITVRAERGDDAVRIDERNGAFTDTISTTITGGLGDDDLAGGSGNETIRGDRGNDLIDGNRGTDIGIMGDGDDTFVWDPGDGSDVVEGQRGNDALVFNGAGGAETVDLSAAGRRLTFFRNPGNVTMDTDGVERTDFNALGGADALTVNDLSRTDVTLVRIDMAAALGGQAGDGAPDNVAVNGTDGDDDIAVVGDASGVSVRWLEATTEILHSQVADDRLAINTLGGSDRVDSGGLAAGVIQLAVDGAPIP